MTTLEALKSSIGYPIQDDNAVKLILIKRGIDASDEVTTELANAKEFELAKADLYYWLSTAANIQEGDYSISITDKSNFLKLASNIYIRYGEEVAEDSKPTIEDGSYSW